MLYTEHTHNSKPSHSDVLPPHTSCKCTCTYVRTVILYNTIVTHYTYIHVHVTPSHPHTLTAGTVRKTSSPWNQSLPCSSILRPRLPRSPSRPHPLTPSRGHLRENYIDLRTRLVAGVRRHKPAPFREAVYPISAHPTGCHA